MPNKKVPDIVISRLPRYLQVLEYLIEKNLKSVSSQELGDMLGITAAQIRKDLSLFGEFGIQGSGYPIDYLISQLQNILNLHQNWDLALVGVGDLGTAIARYQGFQNRGFKIILAFDNDPKKISMSIGNLTIHSTDQMRNLIAASGVKIALLTVPASEAQQVAEELIAAGIKAILNYAPINLNLPDNIQVENVDPILKLQHMTYYL